MICQLTQGGEFYFWKDTVVTPIMGVTAVLIDQQGCPRLVRFDRLIVTEEWLSR